MKVVKLIVLILVVLVAFVLGSQNPQITQVNYLIASAKLPLAAIMSFCFIIGLLVGCFISFRVFSQLKWQNYRLKKQSQKESTQAKSNSLVSNQKES